MSFAQMMVPPVSAKNPVRRGAIHTVTIGETWEVSESDCQGVTLQDLEQWLNRYGNYGVEVKRNTLSIVVDVDPKKPKPSKCIRKGIFEWLKDADKEFPKRFRYQYEKFNRFSPDWVDRYCSKFIVRHPAQRYKVVLSSRFPTQPFLYEHEKQIPPCYYEDGCYQHCGFGGELQRLNGRVIKIFKEETPDWVIERISKQSEKDLEHVVEYYAAGRALLFPVDNHSERYKENAYAIGNLYNREHVPLTISALRRGLCEAIGWEDTGEHVGEGGGWWFNHSPFLIHSPNVTPRRYVYVPDCIHPKKCNCCGQRFNIDELREVGDDLLCESCLEDEFMVCESCDEFARNDDVYTVADWSDGHERMICECCIENDSDIQPVPHWLHCDASYVDLAR